MRQSSNTAFDHAAEPLGRATTNRSRIGRALLALEIAPPRLKDSDAGRNEFAEAASVAVAPRPQPASAPAIQSDALFAPWHEPTGADRREYPRRDSRCLVDVHPLRSAAGETPQQAEWSLHATPLRGAMEDVSMNGVAFVLSEPIERGERLLLRLRSPQRNGRIDCAGLVARCESAAPGCWKIVCRFDSRLTFEQVHEIGQHLFASRMV